MYFKNLVQKFALGARSIHTTGTRSIHTTRVVRSDTRGVFGSNLPFNVENRYLLLFWFSIYFGSGLAVPFLIIRNQILSKNS